MRAIIAFPAGIVLVCVFLGIIAVVSAYRAARGLPSVEAEGDE